MTTETITKQELDELIRIVNDSNNVDAMYKLGSYYQESERNYDEMKKYYLMAIEKNHVDAMYRLGDYYYFYEKNYEEMKKYYLMAIEKGEDWMKGKLQAINSFANYYSCIEKKYDEMKKYYLMAIEKGCVESMCNLAHYYEEIEKNYDEMKKYYLMAIEIGDMGSMRILAEHYQDEENYEEMKKYYLMAIECGCTEAMFNLGDYYQYTEKNYDEMKKYYLMVVEKEGYNGFYSAWCTLNLGLYYQYTEKKYDEMKKYYLITIENNNHIRDTRIKIKAMFNLAVYYQCREKNYKLMKRYYFKIIDYEIPENEISSYKDEINTTKKLAEDNIQEYYRFVYPLPKTVVEPVIDNQKDNYNGQERDPKYWLYHRSDGSFEKEIVDSFIDKKLYILNDDYIHKSNFGMTLKDIYESIVSWCSIYCTHMNLYFNTKIDKTVELIRKKMNKLVEEGKVEVKTIYPTTATRLYTLDFGNEEGNFDYYIGIIKKVRLTRYL
jgi:TPR repeat protein